MDRSKFGITLIVLTLAAFAVLGLLPLVRAQEDTAEAAGDSAAEKGVTSAAGVAAAAPTVFSYQGQLTSAAGTPVTNTSLPMTFRLYTTLTGGTACWTENQNVNVQNGQFTVLLGQTTAIPANCVNGNAYLELAVSGETMSPREMLTAVTTAAKANTLVSEATTLGPLTTNGDLTVNTGIIKAPPGSYLLALDNPTGLHTRMASGGHLLFHIDADNNSTDAMMNVYRNSPYVGGAAEMLLQLKESGDLWLKGNMSAGGSVIADALFGNNILLKGTNVIHQNGSDRTVHILPWVGGDPGYDGVCIGCGTGNARLDVAGQLTANSLVVGNCRINASNGRSTDTEQACEGGSIVSGAYVEANLMTPQELAAETIERFEQGDLLCWSAEGDQLEKCDQANDPLVMGVADANGKPIVLGAEPVKVIGPVKAGDYLVASDTPGYAMASKNPSFGIVIGQALKDHPTGPGLIKAMIRKM